MNMTVSTHFIGQEGEPQEGVQRSLPVLSASSEWHPTTASQPSTKDAYKRFHLPFLSTSQALSP